MNNHDNNKIRTPLFIFGLLFFLCLLSFNSPNNFSKELNGDYDHLWKKVDSLYKKRLYKSGVELIDEIYSKAQKSNNQDQLLKCLLSKTGIWSRYLDESPDLIEAEIKSFVAKAKSPLKEIALSTLASYYWNYYNSNSWIINQLKTSVSSSSQSFRDWNKNDFLKNCNEIYLSTIQNKEELKKYPLGTFKSSITKFDSIFKDDYNLHEFLNISYLNFLKSVVSNNGSNRWVQNLEFERERLISNLDKFNEIEISEGKQTPYFYALINLYKTLYSQYETGRKSDKQIYLDLDRLAFFNSTLKIHNQDSIFLDALEQLSNKFGANPTVSEVEYKIANFYFNKSSLTSLEKKDGLIKAREICKSSIKKFPDALGSKRCEQLIQNIDSKDLRFTTEQVILPNSAFKILVSHKNINKVYARIYELKNNYLEIINKEQLSNYLPKEPMVKNTFDLPKSNDYLTHSIELPFSPLEIGSYLLVLSDNKSNSDKECPVAFKVIRVSNLGYTIESSKNDNNQIYVFNRTTGKPQKEVLIEIKYRNYRSQKPSESNKIKLITNNEGYAKFNFPKNYYSRNITLKKDKDQLFNKNFYISRHWFGNKNAIEKTILFTDRSIYRPGQIIHFKGIVHSGNGKNEVLITNSPTTIYLNGTNNEKIDSLNLTTNEFGSFYGTFKIPKSILNGTLHIFTKSGSKSLQVEQYKRPRFNVEINPINKQYRLNENLELSGIAKSFSGAKISNARVTYTINRQTNYYNPYEKGFYFPSAHKEELESGETKTDKDGNFKINFTLLENQQIKLGPNGIHTFSINVNVTDKSGETQSENTEIHASKNSFLVAVEGSKELNINNPDTIKIIAKNLSGEKINVNANYELFLLEQPELLKPKLWDVPDQAYLDRDAYKKLFPNEAYLNEDNLDSLRRIKKVHSGKIKTDKPLLLPFNKLQPGKYVIEIKAKSQEGETVLTKHYFTSYNPNSKTCPEKSYAWSTLITQKVEPGNNASILIGSYDDQVHAKILIEANGEEVKKETLILSKELKKIVVPVKEDYRGDFFVNIFITKENRAYKFQHRIQVPFSNKKFDLKLETFRDKLEPGNKEKWSIKLNNKIKAEALSYMYDASLDELINHDQTFDIYKLNNPSLDIRKDRFFNPTNSSAISSKTGYLPQIQYPSTPKIMWFYQPYFGSQSYDDLEVAGVRKPGQMDVNYESELPPPSLKNEAKENLAHTPMNGETLSNKIKLRKNLGELAFFFPNQVTKDGQILIQFTAPDQLTKWKFVTLAHDQNLKTGKIEKSVITKKDLMIVPNLPRFYRNGDEAQINFRITNLSSQPISARVELKIGVLDNAKKIYSYLKILEIAPQETKIFNNNINIPLNIKGLNYEITGSTNKFSDGEKGVIPVLPASKILIETLPMPVRKEGVKEFKLPNLLSSKNSTTISHKELTLTHQTNAKLSTLLAVSTLINENSHSTQSVFSTLYGATIAKKELHNHEIYRKLLAIAQSTKYEENLSALTRNPNLKSMILEVSPWSLNAKEELDGIVQMVSDIESGKIEDVIFNAKKVLTETQLSNGAWPWFSNMRPNRFITQDLLIGMGRLLNLYPDLFSNNELMIRAIEKAILYTDNEIRKDFENLKKQFSENELKKVHISHNHIQYLYLRSFFSNIPSNAQTKEAQSYFIDQAKRFWNKKSLMEQAMISIFLNNDENTKTSIEIIRSFRERSQSNDEMGTYWKGKNGYFKWYNAPIETQALIIEAFLKNRQPKNEINEMIIWILKHKQGNQWTNKNATYAAIHALLLQGNFEIKPIPFPDFQIGNQIIKTNDPKFFEDNVSSSLNKTLNEIGFYQKSWSSEEIMPEMGQVRVTKKEDGLSWGGLFWKYEEDLDKINPHKTNLSVTRTLFKQVIENNQSRYVELDKNSTLNPGDKIMVKLGITCDRDLEFIHLKDMRASCFEPMDNLSSSKYEVGLSYYQSTNDASTEFFFEYLQKGKHILEYELVVSQSGIFSHGVTTIQSIYAPSFSAHTAGLKIKVL